LIFSAATKAIKASKYASVAEVSCVSCGVTVSAGQRLPQPRVDLLRGFLLHARHHVRVGVCGDLDARVTAVVSLPASLLRSRLASSAAAGVPPGLPVNELESARDDALTARIASYG